MILKKMDPYASRETLDHSIMYIFAVALEDGEWHHIKSYTPQRARRKSTINFGTKFQLVRIQNGLKNITKETQIKKVLGEKLLFK